MSGCPGRYAATGRDLPHVPLESFPDHCAWCGQRIKAKEQKS